MVDLNKSVSIYLSNTITIAWNVGTHLFLAWVGLDCLFFGINSIIWNHNTINWAPVWCDISQFFFFSASSGDYEFSNIYVIYISDQVLLRG